MSSTRQTRRAARRSTASRPAPRAPAPASAPAANTVTSGAAVPEPVYTYRAGEKLPLAKRVDHFVVRQLGPALGGLHARALEQVSSASTRIKVRPSELEAQMALARELAPTHHAYQAVDTGEEFLITDRVMLRFRPDTPPEAIDALLGRYALRVLQRYSPLDMLLQLTDHTGMNPVKLVVQLTEQEPIVEVVDNDVNQRMQSRQLALPTDTHYLAAWHLHQRRQHPQVDPRASAGCEQAWQLLGHHGSPEVVIAVTDDGCRLDHADFNGPGKFAAWGYFVGSQLVTSAQPAAQPSAMYQADADHGTACAGVAAGEADGVLTVGAAPGCRLLPVKWESDGASLFVSDSKLLDVLNWIADKADVMSNSWGTVPDSRYAALVTDRIVQLSASGGRRGRGIVFLWAAGNENCPIQHDAAVPVPYTPGWVRNAAGTWVWAGVRRTQRFRNALVALPGVLHVAALASNAQRSHYSNHGTGIDLTAPSSNSHTYGRLTVPGLGVVAPEGGPQPVTMDFGGTSSATPLVAGVAALVISANPLLTAAEVASVLRRTASKDLDFRPYARTPPASYDPSPVWDVSPIAPFADGAFVDTQHPDGSWSPWFGHGKVDAAAAVAAALALATPPAPVDPATGWQAASQRSLDIPDADPAGVEDRLVLTGAGNAVRIDVQVDIEHPYIGDLDVTLLAPDGRAAVLHQRSGGNTAHLQRAWSSADTAGLAGLRGVAVAGDWVLRVRDLARVDVGRLRGWQLAITPAATAGPVDLVDTPGLAIPDNQPSGVTRSLRCDSSGRVSDLRVEVDITHTYIGDLRLRLRAPSGSVALLHDRSGAGSDNLIRSWTPADTPALAALLGLPAAGDWQLTVSDHDVRDLGKLNGWGLRLALGA